MQPLISIKEKRRRRFFWRLKIYGGLVCLIIVLEAVFYAVYYLPFFKIKSLEITGLDNLSAPVVLSNITASAFDNYLAQFLGFDNFFSWPKSLANIGLVIKGADFQKDFLENRLIINVQERKKYGLWCVRDPLPNPPSADGQEIFEKQDMRFGGKSPKQKCFWFDDGGIIFRPESNDKANFPVIEKINNKELSVNGNLLGSQILPLEHFSYLRKILEFLKENPILKAARLSWLDVGQELSGKLDSGPVLKFGVRFDPANNLEALKQISQRKDFLKMSYVDLRIENKIYYQ